MNRPHYLLVITTHATALKVSARYSSHPNYIYIQHKYYITISYLSFIMESGLGSLSSKSRLVYCVHFNTNALGRFMNLSLILSAKG